MHLKIHSIVTHNLSVRIKNATDKKLLAVEYFLVQIICDDLKYRDMQNDPQYVLLNSRLKEGKRLKKRVKTMPKHIKIKPVEKNGKKASKFTEKYEERIKSIYQQL